MLQVWGSLTDYDQGIGGAVVISRLGRGRVTHMVVGRPQVLLAGGWTLQFLSTWASRQGSSHRGSWFSDSQRAPKMAVRLFKLMLRSDRPSFLSYSLESSYQVQPMPRRWGPLVAISEAACHTTGYASWIQTVNGRDRRWGLCS